MNVYFIKAIMLSGVTFENISIIELKNNVKSENLEKSIASDKYIVEGRVLKVNNTDIKKLSSNFTFSNVSIKEKVINIKI
jgi:hypothetical protein